MSRPPLQTQDSRSGFLLALLTYLIWGFMPVFFKQTAHMPLFEVIAHRVLWSLPIAMVVLIILGKMSDFKSVITSPKVLRMAALPAFLVTSNWSIYVWAVSAGYTLDAALGYYINPLFSVLLAAILLGEKLSKLQWAAMGSAAIGVAILTWENGSLPIVALLLSTTWGFYAYFKRALPLEPNQGFTLEITILFPFALLLAGYFFWTGEAEFATSAPDTLLLMACGLATAGPLLLYANGAKRMRLSTIAMMQYISPSIIFILAVFVFKEPFSTTKLCAFIFIWSALALFTFASLTKQK